MAASPRLLSVLAATWREGWRELHNSRCSLRFPRFSGPSELLLISFETEMDGFSGLRAACLPCHVRGATLHGRLVVRRSPSQLLFFFRALLRPSDALDVRPLHEASHAARRRYRRTLGASATRSATGPATTATSCKFHVSKPTAWLSGSSELMPS